MHALIKPTGLPHSLIKMENIHVDIYHCISYKSSIISKASYNQSLESRSISLTLILTISLLYHNVRRVPHSTNSYHPRFGLVHYTPSSTVANIFFLRLIPKHFHNLTAHHDVYKNYYKI